MTHKAPAINRARERRAFTVVSMPTPLASAVARGPISRWSSSARGASAIKCWREWFKLQLCTHLQSIIVLTASFVAKIWRKRLD